MAYFPNISIIIAVQNEAKALQDTLRVLSKQRYPNLEVIVIDGASNDGTQDIIRNSPCTINTWISEKDSGIADAFNKGIGLAKGEYINFQGAGDSFTSNNVLCELFHDVPQGSALVCGRVQRIAEDGITALWQAPKKWPKQFKKTQLLFKMALPHQGLFTHRDFFYRYGLFNTQCKFAMDYEYLLRAYHEFPEVICKDIVVANWRAGGVGTDKIKEIYDEYHKIKLQHQVASKWLLTGIDKWNRTKYAIKSVLKQAD